MAAFTGFGVAHGYLGMPCGRIVAWRGKACGWQAGVARCTLKNPPTPYAPIPRGYGARRTAFVERLSSAWISDHRVSDASDHPL